MLRDQWLSLWTRLGGNPAAGQRPYDRLTARYAEPHRHYHTLEHIACCLRELGIDFGHEEPRDKNAVEMAIWFHDAIYDPKAKDNEARSAELASTVLNVGGFGDAFIEKVSDLVMATAHVEAPVDYDAQVLIDIDLSVLGQDERTFDEYERAVRREYEWVPPDVFCAKRREILGTFLVSRPGIYSTYAFRRKYEDQARANLFRSIDRLKRGIVPV